MRLPGDIGDLYTSTLMRTRQQYLRMKGALEGIASPRASAMQRDVDEALRKLDAELERRGVGHEQTGCLCQP